MILFTYQKNVWLDDKKVYYNVDKSYMCGGTLITRNTVLSAAHCVITQIEFTAYGSDYTVSVDVSKSASMYKVYLGFQDITSNSDGLGVISQVSSVNAVINHLFNLNR